MGLDEELKKAKEGLSKRPPWTRKAYEEALNWLKNRLGEKGFNEFMKATDISDKDSEINKLDKFLKELENKGVFLCDDCKMETTFNFFQRRKECD